MAGKKSGTFDNAGIEGLAKDKRKRKINHALFS